MATLAPLLQRLTRERGPRPFLTFSDATTGERTELSGTGFENWVAKTANLVLDELAVAPGQRVGLYGGTHWTFAVAAVATWHVGGCVVPIEDADEVGEVRRLAAAFVREGSTPPRAAAGPIVVVGRGLGGRLAGPRDGQALVFGEDVLACGDEPPDEIDRPDLPALSWQRGTTDRATLFAEAARAWPPGTRVLCALPLLSEAGLVRGLLGALACGGSLVLPHGYDGDGLARLAEMERVDTGMA